MIADRRRFLKATGAAFASLSATACVRPPLGVARSAGDFGPLLRDPAELLDLPAGFTYRVLSQLGDPMSDGARVPDCADGMGSFKLGGGKIALVRNHELYPGQNANGDFAIGYQRDAAGKFLPGGTTTLVLDAATLRVERQFRSLAGTMINCAGGITPWGSWLTCEEPGPFIRRATNHGYIFEVPASATGLVDPVPLKAMGRFNHEAACVDPTTGVVYMTEDQGDGLLYRFLPNMRDRLGDGGRLQAMALRGVKDTRNWVDSSIQVGDWAQATWIDLDNPESPDDDLRVRGGAAGATLFARGEGMWMGDGELYFCCTNGGTAKLGQIFRLRPQPRSLDKLQLFFESSSAEQFNFGDNLTISPSGHLVVCEDQYTTTVANHLRWITPDGRVHPFALNRLNTELAGACFSPDGQVLFVNIYRPAKTLAITGPWPG